MEVFSDFQCPACKQLYKTTNQQLLDNYVNTNKVYLVHRDFPLPMHAHSRVAARYVRAAAQLGKAEQAEQALFQNQEKWEQSGDIDGTLAAVLPAADMTKIRAQAKGTALDPGIDKDVALGKTYNVNQTPTTIIHFKGRPIGGGIVSYDVLRQFLGQLLQRWRFITRICDRPQRGRAVIWLGVSSGGFSSRRLFKTHHGYAPATLIGVALSFFAMQFDSYRILPVWSWLCDALPFVEIGLGLLFLLGWKLTSGTLLPLIMQVFYRRRSLYAMGLQIDGYFANPEPLNQDRVAHGPFLLVH
jgi:hypothetical protein